MNAQKKLTWATILAMVLTLSACGQQSNPAAAINNTTQDQTQNFDTDFNSDFSNDPSTATSSYDPATDSTDPTAPVIDPTPTPTPTASATPTPLPSIAPTPPPVLGESIVQNLQKSYPGIFSWEKCKVSFQVRNPFWLKTLKERMVVTYTLKGAVVEVKEVQIQLSPAMISNFEYTSTKHADDASVATYAY